jgi:hypothetical protein
MGARGAGEGIDLSGRLAAAVSRTTLIRLVRVMADPAVGASPRVLGVDEFALRKRRRYGTLLVDVETPLAGRHPGRALVGLAGRWHLWHNLAKAVERAVSRHHGHLAAAVRAQAPPAVPARGPAPPPMPAPPRAGRIASRTRSRHADVHRLLAEGRSQAHASQELGLSRKTVRRFARAASPEELLASDGTGKQASILDEHAAYLRERWNSGCTNAAQLWAELRDRGYPEARPTSASTSPASAEPPPSPT